MGAVVRRAHQTRQFMGTTRWTRRTYACVMAQIIRPVRGKVQVRLPYQPHGANYHLLQDVCGEQTRPKWRSELRVFEVAREHLTKLIDRLSAAIGEPVEVVLHGVTQTKCVSACWAASPDTRWECVCSCAGSNHGSGRPLPIQPSADLSIDNEYTTEIYWIYPSSS
jgi:hypothetical protein